MFERFWFIFLRMLERFLFIMRFDWLFFFKRPFRLLVRRKFLVLRERVSQLGYGAR